MFFFFVFFSIDRNVSGTSSSSDLNTTGKYRFLKEGNKTERLDRIDRTGSSRPIDEWWFRVRQSTRGGRFFFFFFWVFYFSLNMFRSFLLLVLRGRRQPLPFSFLNSSTKSRTRLASSRPAISLSSGRHRRDGFVQVEQQGKRGRKKKDSVSLFLFLSLIHLISSLVHLFGPSPRHVRRLSNKSLSLPSFVFLIDTRIDDDTLHPSKWWLSVCPPNPGLQCPRIGLFNRKKRERTENWEK